MKSSLFRSFSLWSVISLICFLVCLFLPTSREGLKIATRPRLRADGIHSFAESRIYPRISHVFQTPQNFPIPYPLPHTPPPPTASPTRHTHPSAAETPAAPPRHHPENSQMPCS